MSSLPDWLVERAALDEVATNRDRIERADPSELADRIAALRAENAAELAAYPAEPAVAQIETRVARERQAARRRRTSLVAVAAASVGVAAIALLVLRPGQGTHVAVAEDAGALVAVIDDPNTEYIGVKGASRLVVYRHAGDRAELLKDDDYVEKGDRLQIRYKPGGKKYGLIASIDGGGFVTLHHPASEDAPPEATLLADKTTTLPHAYALDDAPRFERFFFITADQPIDVQRSLEKLRGFARRTDSETAALGLSPAAGQWSLRLKKPKVPPIQ